MMEIAVVVLNSTAGTAKYVVNELRKKGIKAGLVKPRIFRPFPLMRLLRRFQDVSRLLFRTRQIVSMPPVDHCLPISQALFVKV